MLLGNKSYAAEKPVYSPLNGATFVRKCICRLSSLWVVPMKKIAKSSLPVILLLNLQMQLLQKNKKDKRRKINQPQMSLLFVLFFTLE